MKISDRTTPILERLKNGKLSSLSIHPEDVPNKSDIEKMRLMFIEFSKNSFNTYYLTDKFIEAYESVSKNLLNSNLWELIENQNICFVSKTVSVCLKIKNDREKGIMDIETFSISNVKILKEPVLNYLGTVTYLYDIDKNDDGKARILSHVGYFANYFKEIYSMNCIDHIASMIPIILFINFAEIETKYLPPKSKIKEIKCKYINETSNGITILDSRWFTNLVKSDVFNVRGHFRLQPKKKNGEWTKELIWINEFQKSGYTSPAKKLTHER